MKEVIMQVASYSSDYPKAPIYVADLVRCKECKHNPKGIGWVSCPMTGADTRKPDDFCSYGTRSKMEQVEDEPQTDTEIAKAIVHKMIDDAVIAEDAYPDLRQKMHDAVDKYESQTDCAWGECKESE